MDLLAKTLQRKDFFDDEIQTVDDGVFPILDDLQHLHIGSLFAIGEPVGISRFGVLQLVQIGHQNVDQLKQYFFGGHLSMMRFLPCFEFFQRFSYQLGAEAFFCFQVI